MKVEVIGQSSWSRSQVETRQSGWLVGWSLTSLFSTNTAISETKKQGNRRYQILPALCTPITPFPADEFSGFLFALVWHAE